MKPDDDKEAWTDSDGIDWSRCPECGNVQGDMGVRVKCEECGHAPMPTKPRHATRSRRAKGGRRA